MAEDQRRSVTDDDPRRKGGMTGGGAAVADEGDMPFGIMAAIAVVIGIIAALAAGGSFSGGDDAEAETVKAEASVEEEAEESAPTTEAPTTTAAPTTEAPPAEPADATVTVSANEIVLSGTVPDQATADALYAQALESFSADAIIDELEVVDGAEPYSLTVTGEAADAATFDVLSAGFGALGADADYTDELAQAEPTGAAATVTATQAGITLAGTVPDQATADELLAAALAAYPEDRITNELEVLDGAEPYTLTVTGETTDPVLFGQLNEAFGPLGEGADSFDNSLEQTESSDVEAELNALDQILFQSGTDVIVPESIAVVEAAAELMQANPDVAFEVGGHTDTRGSAESNQALSEARANAVVAALVELGVTNELTPVGYGESRPLDANDTTAELQQANRRIEFRVL